MLLLCPWSFETSNLLSLHPDIPVCAQSIQSTNIKLLFQTHSPCFVTPSSLTNQASLLDHPSAPKPAFKVPLNLTLFREMILLPLTPFTTHVCPHSPFTSHIPSYLSAIAHALHSGSIFHSPLRQSSTTCAWVPVKFRLSQKPSLTLSLSNPLFSSPLTVFTQYHLP